MSADGTNWGFETLQIHAGLSLVIHPASITHSQLNAQEQLNVEATLLLCAEVLTYRR